MCRHNGLIFLSLGLAARGVTIGSTLAYLLAQQASGPLCANKKDPDELVWWMSLGEQNRLWACG